MRKIIYIIILSLIFTSCGDFLDNYPKGRWHSGNFDDNGSGQHLLILSKLLDGYDEFRGFDHCFPVVAMQNHTTPDATPGGPAGDGGIDFSQFPTMSFTPSNTMFSNYYTSLYRIITHANEALAMIEVEQEKQGESDELNQLIAEAYFIRGLAYFRLTQAFGAVPYTDKMTSNEDEIPDQLSVAEIHSKYLTDLKWAINYLPTRMEAVSSGNVGRATQNAVRAIIAKTYLYDKEYGNCIIYTQQIISSGDNNLTTPYDEIFFEKNEYGSESVWEVNAEFKPNLNIEMMCQWSMVQGIRGFPNLGWGHNAPSQELLGGYETGDPRKSAIVLQHGDIVDGETIKGQAGAYQYYNKKAYCPLSERSQYGREDWNYGYWSNIRVIRYADILLMHAEAACEQGTLDDAKEKLEMIRERARNGQPVLPKITTTDQNLLKDAIRHERRIELALEHERYFDLVRWGVAKDDIASFIVGKHELFPIPQSEIDKSEGKLIQNPSYN